MKYSITTRKYRKKNVIYINYLDQMLVSLPRISPTLHKSIAFNHRHECLRLAKEKSELFILLQLNAISMGLNYFAYGDGRYDVQIFYNMLIIIKTKL